MAYTKTNWVNGTTPLNDKNMNKIENELENLDTNMNKILSEIYVGKEEPFAGEKMWFRKGKNLFDKSKALLGYWIGNEQGDIAKGPNDVFLTDFIPVFKNVPVYIPATGSARREFYNKNKVGTTYLNNKGAQVFTPTEDGFIRVTCNMNTITMDSLMIYYGTTETEYEAYIEPQIFVKNSNGAYEEFVKKSEEVYSTEEVKIGTWIDGKPLYRKTFNITSGFSTSFNITHNISNIDYCKCYGTLITGSSSTTEQFYASSTDYFRCFRDGDFVKIRYGTNNNPTTIIINLEYTKTTD